MMPPFNVAAIVATPVMTVPIPVFIATVPTVAPVIPRFVILVVPVATMVQIPLVPVVATIILRPLTTSVVTIVLVLAVVAVILRIGSRGRSQTSQHEPRSREHVCDPHFQVPFTVSRDVRRVRLTSAIGPERSSHRASICERADRGRYLASRPRLVRHRLVASGTLAWWMALPLMSASVR